MKIELLNRFCLNTKLNFKTSKMHTVLRPDSVVRIINSESIYYYPKEVLFSRLCEHYSQFGQIVQG